jgi:hypothetical protein
MWVPEKMVIQELSNTTLKILDRRYFEVCVLTESMRELQSGDQYVTNSDQLCD